MISSLHPDVQLFVGIGDKPVNLVEEGVDCVIRAGELPDTSLVAETIFRDCVVTCASPAYLKRYGIPTAPEMLECNHRIVGYFGGMNGKPRPLRFTEKGGRRLISRFDIATNDSVGNINMMVAGLGLGQTHATVVRGQLASGVLIQILDQWTTDTFPISVIRPPSKRMSAQLRAFIDLATKRPHEEVGREPESAF
ncbi:LysR substrate-binding domain-containing protein [Methylobacterium mesophilicum]